ncbi:related to histidinol-phosphatase [Ramularia collo-cygni]|uniref:Histidinol-phosphatase n=1 Tax=Ramularia collo-cygni TaxID=112498 RepID=A0A2D3V720_9PEZI|nr:related to histidinol-phosphatase [Ramularia collo-cygni]CZT18344.1 related to histidinol-phosphatase [Ramularia collo-cygni]
MPFSHHSHSGQFCGHATSTLEQVVQHAIAKRMTTFCLTEHIPREEIDFYPEESSFHTQETLTQLFDDFYHEARRLQKLYANQIQLLVGFESEWIRPSSLNIIQDILKKYPVDLFVGSVHHVHTIPIDYDTPLYHSARTIAGGTDEQIYADYFDSQYEMLQALKPPVVGHFDLIRLKGDEPDRSFRTWPKIWGKIERNLKFVASYGGVLELNTSSLRKGMSEAYPQSEICIEFKDMGGRFTLSDDSHGIEHVALNYKRAWENNVLRAGLPELVCLAPTADKTKVHDDRFPGVCWESFPVADLAEHAFFQT